MTSRITLALAILLTLAIGSSSAAPQAQSGGGANCNGPECDGEGSTYWDPFTQHPHLVINYTPSAGQTNIEHPVDGGPPTCSDCDPCSAEIEIFETSSACTYQYNGGGAKGDVPGGSHGNAPAPSYFTLTRACNAEGWTETQVTASCNGGASVRAALARVRCKAYTCQ